MRLRYKGGLSSVTLDSARGSCAPGGTLDVKNEQVAVLAVESGEWEPVDIDRVPTPRSPVKPTPQKGG
jgi:hypothetical protein